MPPKTAVYEHSRLHMSGCGSPYEVLVLVVPELQLSICVGRATPSPALQPQPPSRCPSPWPRNWPPLAIWVGTGWKPLEWKLPTINWSRGPPPRLVAAADRRGCWGRSQRRGRAGGDKEQGRKPGNGESMVRHQQGVGQIAPSRARAWAVSLAWPRPSPNRIRAPFMGSQAHTVMGMRGNGASCGGGKPWMLLWWLWTVACRFELGCGTCGLAAVCPPTLSTAFGPKPDRAITRLTPSMYGYVPLRLASAHPCHPPSAVPLSALLVRLLPRLLSGGNLGRYRRNWPSLGRSEGLSEACGRAHASWLACGLLLNNPRVTGSSCLIPLLSPVI